GSQSAGPVVDPRVHHAGVVAGLMPGDAVFLLQDDDLEAGPAALQRLGGREAHDACPYDHDIGPAQKALLNGQISNRCQALPRVYGSDCRISRSFSSLSASMTIAEPTMLPASLRRAPPILMTPLSRLAR